jgi:hypothetical protein
MIRVEQLEARDLMYAALPLNYDPTIDYYPATPALTQDHSRAMPALGPQTTVNDVVPWSQRGFTHNIHDGTGGCCCAKCLGLTTASAEADELFDITVVCRGGYRNGSEDGDFASAISSKVFGSDYQDCNGRRSQTMPYENVNEPDLGAFL